MGLDKLREWVGTVTGKGRWGRDRIGRSAPAFLAASTTALPPSTCTARRGAGRHRLRLLFRCEASHLLAVVVEACAGRRVRRLCLPAVLVLQALFACCQFCHVMPTALLTFLPPFCSFCLPLFIPCAPGSASTQQVTSKMFASCETVPLAAATRACSGGPCAGF